MFSQSAKIMCSILRTCPCRKHTQKPIFVLIWINLVSIFANVVSISGQRFIQVSPVSPEGSRLPHVHAHVTVCSKPEGNIQNGGGISRPQVKCCSTLSCEKTIPCEKIIIWMPSRGWKATLLAKSFRILQCFHLFWKIIKCTDLFPSKISV